MSTNRPNRHSNKRTGRPAAGVEWKRVVVMLNSELYDTLHQTALATDRSIAALVRRGVAKELEAARAEAA
jgi:hypothetical protein